MENLERGKICPHSGARKMKKWGELTDEQKFLVERLPLNTDFSPQDRKKHRFCVQCWFEETEQGSQTC